MTVEELHKLLTYNPELGLFTWNITDRRKRVGERAGTSSPRQGYAYRVIKIGGRKYLEHRLAWFWMTGEWPEMVDHIDGDPSNNKWENLRAASRGENGRNAKVRSDSSSGVKGVRQKGSKWEASISVGGKKLFVGSFDTVEEAEAVVRAKRQELHGEFARHE